MESSEPSCTCVYGVQGLVWGEPHPVEIAQP